MNIIEINKINECRALLIKVSDGKVENLPELKKS